MGVGGRASNCQSPGRGSHDSAAEGLLSQSRVLFVPPREQSGLRDAGGRSRSSGLQPPTWQSVVMGAEVPPPWSWPRGGWHMTRLPERRSGRAPGVTSGL